MHLANSVYAFGKMDHGTSIVSGSSQGSAIPDNGGNAVGAPSDTVNAFGKMEHDTSVV